MDTYIAVVATIGPILIVLLCKLFFERFLPTYFDKKAENLATKEDIAAITREVEEVKQIYQGRLDLSRAEREFYDAMIKNIWSFLSVIKKYEFEEKIKLTKEAVLSNPNMKKALFEFVDSANEILGRAFVFLPENHYKILNDAILEKGNFNDMAKNILLAMRKSIHPDTELNKDTHIREINY